MIYWTPLRVERRGEGRASPYLHGMVGCRAPPLPPRPTMGATHAWPCATLGMRPREWEGHVWAWWQRGHPPKGPLAMPRGEPLPWLLGHGIGLGTHARMPRINKPKSPWDDLKQPSQTKVPLVQTVPNDFIINKYDT